MILTGPRGSPPRSPSRSPAHRASVPASRIGILDPPSSARLFRTPDAVTADSAVTVGQTCLVTLSQSIKTSRAQPCAAWAGAPSSRPQGLGDLHGVVRRTLQELIVIADEPTERP